MKGMRGDPVSATTGMAVWEELEARAAEAQQLRGPFGGEKGATEEKGFGDPFGYSDLRDPDSLAVPILKLPDGGPDWEETAAAMRVKIAELTDPASNGRFKADNRAVLDQMRDDDRDAWNSVELRLGDRDRELREGQ
jgi:hypothetical protein